MTVGRVGMHLNEASPNAIGFVGLWMAKLNEILYKLGGDMRE